MKNETLNRLKLLASEIRLETMKIIASKGNGHVGGSLSIADVLAVLYGEVMRYKPEDPDWKERDWLVLSKGHAGPAMYAALGIVGYYQREDAYHLNEAGSDFPSHTDHSKTKGVDLTTGSLGQGISQAVGAALGNKMQGIDSHVFVICGDGECDEGQVWEAAQFAAHYHLDNLIGFVDNNGRQLDGTVEEVMSHGKGIGAKFDAFGWEVIDVKDGNDVKEILEAIHRAYEIKDKPTMIILNTVKGKGIDFAETSGEHSSTLNAEQWEEVIAEAERKYEALKEELS